MSTAVVKLDEVNALLPKLCGRCRCRVEALTVLPMQEGAEDSIVRLRRIVAGECGMTEEMLLSRSRAWPRVAARRKFARRARGQGYSMLQIGRALTQNHTTVMNLLDPKRKAMVWQRKRSGAREVRK